HLQLDQPFLPRLIVEQLLVGHGLDLLHDPVESRHREAEGEEQEIVEEEHVASCNYRSARSNFNRMFTKLYGGHGPVYRNESLLSYFLAISEIWSSKAFVF